MKLLIMLLFEEPATCKRERERDKVSEGKLPADRRTPW
jgi:hypothetical protein